ncbi:MAG: flagellar biosynthesis protein FliQ [Spirochaetales bacterium]|nr:flagellar biosynthesis protein FliQ [Spirochaetales bacterium]
MSIGFAVSIIRSGVFQVLTMAAPMLLVGLGVGLIVSILQATTSIQEQTLTFVPKIAAILLAVALFGPWIMTSMREFTLAIMSRIPDMVR